MPNLNDFLSRIQTDHAFYLEFRRNPEEALEPYELSAEERAALTESREQLRNCLGQPNSYWKIELHVRFARIRRTGVQRCGNARRGRKFRVRFGQIRKASRHTDRLTPVIALMEQIG